MWNQGNAYISGKSLPPPPGVVAFGPMWIQFLYFPTEHLWFLPEGNRKLQFSEGKLLRLQHTGLYWNLLHFLHRTCRLSCESNTKIRPMSFSLLQKKSCPLTAWRNSESLIFEGTPPLGGGKQLLFLYLNFAFPWMGAAWVSQRFTSARRISHWVCGYIWLLLLCNKTTFCWFP